MKEDPTVYLSAKQKQWLKGLDKENIEVFYDKNFEVAWERMNRAKH